MSEFTLSKTKMALIFSIFPFLIIVGGLACAPKTLPGTGLGSPVGKSDQADAIEAAQIMFSERRAAGVNMSDGPCLADEIIPGWSADTAHSPRQPIDDLPENQCQAFRNGVTKHFVELDTEGKFLRAY